MNYFEGCKSIDEVKAIYRDLSKKFHPDLGGNAEDFKQLKNDLDMFLKSFMAGKFTEFEKQSKDLNSFAFADFLKKIIDWNVTIEIIGFWVYVKDSIVYKDQLKEMGCWFSGKHKAWIYNGGKKVPIRSKYTVGEVRSKWGVQTVREKENLTAIA